MRNIILTIFVLSFFSCGGGNGTGGAIDLDLQEITWSNPEGIFVSQDNSSFVSLLSSEDKLYELNVDGSISEIGFLDSDGESVETSVQAIYKINDDYFLLKLPSGQVFLVNKNTKRVTKMTEYMNSDFLYAVIRNGFLYTANKAKNSIYKTDLTTLDTELIHNPDINVEVHQSNSFPGFYVTSDNSVITIANLNYVIFLNGVKTFDYLTKNTSNDWSVNLSLWSDVPYGNKTMIYGENGKLYEIIDEYLDNNGIWTCTYKLREFTYNAYTTYIDHTGSGRGSADSYATMTDTNFLSLGPTATPLWISHLKNQMSLEERNRYLISPIGYFTVTPIVAGGLNIAFQAKNLSDLNNREIYISSGYAYWLDLANNIQRFQLTPASVAEVVTNDSVTDWFVSDNYLFYSTATQTKKIDLNNIAGGPTVVMNGQSQIASYMSF